MKRDTTLWNDPDSGGEGGAGERLSERSARFVETLMDKLARHGRCAEQLAEATRTKRRNS